MDYVPNNVRPHPARVRFKLMCRPEDIKALRQSWRGASNPALRIKPGPAHQTRRCALNPARRLGYVHAVLG